MQTSMCKFFYWYIYCQYKYNMLYYKCMQSSDNLPSSRDKPTSYNCTIHLYANSYKSSSRDQSTHNISSSYKSTSYKSIHLYAASNNPTGHNNQRTGHKSNSNMLHLLQLWLQQHRNFSLVQQQPMLLLCKFPFLGRDRYQPKKLPHILSLLLLKLSMSYY